MNNEINPSERLDFPADSSVNDNARTNGNMSMDARLLNIDQVCRYLNLGRWKVYELIHEQKLKTVKIGARRLVSARALAEFIEALERGDDGTQT